MNQELFPEDPASDGEFSLDPAKPLVVLIGWIDHEGIVSTLQTKGRQYKKKILESSPENWQSITELFSRHKVTAVVGKIPPHGLKLLLDSRYKYVRDSLFSAIGGVPNQIFLFEDLLEGEQKDKSRASYAPFPPKEQLDEAIAFLRSHGIHLVPYAKRAEVTVLAEAFLEDVERNLLLRIYVPTARLWAGETDRFLQLFQDYLARVERLQVRLDQKRTEHGVVYEFHGQPLAGHQSLEPNFLEFSRLMTLFETDPDEAKRVMSSKSPNATEIARLITKYSKEARRLQLDIKHEAEAKVVSIRHRLEAELLDLDPSAQEWQKIQAMIGDAVPHLRGPLSGEALALGARGDGNQHIQVTYNLRPQFIGTVNGIVAEEIAGNQHFAPEHHQLLELIRKHGGADAGPLETAVYEVADQGVEKTGRLRAKQRLLDFLIGAGKKTGDVAFGILQRFIEKQLGL